MFQEYLTRENLVLLAILLFVVFVSMNSKKSESFVSETNQQISSGTVQSNVTSGTVQSNVTSGTVQSNVTSGTVQSNVTSGVVQQNNVTSSVTKNMSNSINNSEKINTLKNNATQTMYKGTDTIVNALTNNVEMLRILPYGASQIIDAGLNFVDVVIDEKNRLGVNTDKLCIGKVCLNENELKSIKNKLYR